MSRAQLIRGVPQKQYIKEFFDKEDRVDNQRGTWQNWVYRNVPMPIDFLGLPGTKYNLGSVARRWGGKPQLDYDAGQLYFGTSQGQIAGYQPNLALDNPPRLVD